MTIPAIDALRAQRKRLEEAQLHLADERADKNWERARTRKSRKGISRRALQEMEDLTNVGHFVERRAAREPRAPRGLAARDLETDVQLLLVNELLKRENRIAREGLEVVVEDVRVAMRVTASTDEAAKAAREVALSFLDDLLVQLATKERCGHASAVKPWFEEVVWAELSFEAGLLRAGLAGLSRNRSASSHEKYFRDRDRAELGVLERFLGSHSLSSRRTFMRYCELIALEACAPPTAHDGALYCEAWRDSVARLSTRLLAQYQG
jgi:hypothetical protein